MKRIKKISIAVCMLTAFMVTFSACSKYEIRGSWELLNEKGEPTGELWTFQPSGEKVTYSWKTRYYYELEKNIILCDSSGDNILAIYAIIKFDRHTMRLSGGGETLSFKKMR